MSLEGDVEVGDAVEVRRHRLHLRTVDWAPAVVTEVREKLLLVQLADGDLVMIGRGDHEWRPPIARLVAIEATAQSLVAAIEGGGGHVLANVPDDVKRAVEALVAACAKTAAAPER
mgnify:CR=1 FL=1